MITLALLLVVAAADGEDAAPKRVASVMPLIPQGTVTAKQAKGVTAQLRGAVQALVDDELVRFLPETKDDERAVRKCGSDASCYDDLVTQRGADRLLFGSVEAKDGALVISATRRPDGKTFTAIVGDDDAAYDRLAREAFAEETLRGTLTLDGQPGDQVTLDGARRGTLDEDGAFSLDKLREGPHQLTVTRAISKNGTAYEPFSREVQVRHKETTTIKITLLPKQSTSTLDGEAAPEEASVGLPIGPIITVTAGSLVVAGGITLGTLSLLDSLAVEERAEQQQLVFPRDQELVERGQSFALGANVLYGLGAVTIAGGVAWWILSSSPQEPQQQEEQKP